MDWERYKALCDAPEVCSRWLLEQTLELVDDAALAEELRAALAGEPLAKPAGHRGGAESDMFALSLSLAQVQALRRQVERARVHGATTSATRDRGLGGFIEAWLEYERHLARGTGSGSCSARS